MTQNDNQNLDAWAHAQTANQQSDGYVEFSASALDRNYSKHFVGHVVQV